jgi:hypothetical protein
MNDKGICEHCGESFGYRLIHNGFNESAYAYCDTCGMTALLDGWKIPQSITIQIHQGITPEVEQHLMPCKCGGHFVHSAFPRCPKCLKPLSAEKATKWIEDNAPGTKKGWRWQRNWTGPYCILIDDRVTQDNWKNE